MAAGMRRDSGLQVCARIRQQRKAAACDSGSRKARTTDGLHDLILRLFRDPFAVMPRRNFVSTSRMRSCKRLLLPSAPQLLACRR